MLISKEWNFSDGILAQLGNRDDMINNLLYVMIQPYDELSQIACLKLFKTFIPYASTRLDVIYVLLELLKVAFKAEKVAFNHDFTGQVLDFCSEFAQHSRLFCKLTFDMCLEKIYSALNHEFTMRACVIRFVRDMCVWRFIPDAGKLLDMYFALSNTHLRKINDCVDKFSYRILSVSLGCMFLLCKRKMISSKSAFNRIYRYAIQALAEVKDSKIRKLFLILYVKFLGFLLMFDNVSTVDLNEMDLDEQSNFESSFKNIINSEQSPWNLLAISPHLLRINQNLSKSDITPLVRCYCERVLYGNVCQVERFETCLELTSFLRLLKITNDSNLFRETFNNVLLAALSSSLELHKDTYFVEWTVGAIMETSAEPDDTQAFDELQAILMKIATCKRTAKSRLILLRRMLDCFVAHAYRKWPCDSVRKDAGNKIHEHLLKFIESLPNYIQGIIRTIKSSSLDDDIAAIKLEMATLNAIDSIDKTDITRQESQTQLLNEFIEKYLTQDTSPQSLFKIIKLARILYLNARFADSKQLLLSIGQDKHLSNQILPVRLFKELCDAELNFIEFFREKLKFDGNPLEKQKTMVVQHWNQFHQILLESNSKNRLKNESALPLKQTMNISAEYFSFRMRYHLNILSFMECLEKAREVNKDEAQDELMDTLNLMDNLKTLELEIQDLIDKSLAITHLYLSKNQKLKMHLELSITLLLVQKLRNGLFNAGASSGSSMSVVNANQTQLHTTPFPIEIALKDENILISCQVNEVLKLFTRDIKRILMIEHSKSRLLKQENSVMIALQSKLI